MAKLILVSGKKRSGKDYSTSLLAGSLRSRGYSVEVKSFAEPMKQIMSVIFGVSLGTIETAKNEPHNFPIVMTQSNTEANVVRFSTDMRQILQRFGSEAMKPIFGDDVWVRLMDQYVQSSSADFIIVPDFRFLIEHIPSAITIRVKYNLAESADQHVSEIELDDFTFDYVLNNDNHQLTQQDLDNFVTMLLESYNA